MIIFKESSVYDEHQIITITQNNLDYNRFNSIKAAEDLKSYLIYTLDNLYTVDALTKEIPIFIPLNPVRLNFFENNNECNTKIDYATTCINEVHKFRCVISNLAEYFKYKCGAEYDYDYELWKDTGNTSMTLNAGGTFECSWSNINNALFRKGKKFDSTKTYKEIGNISICILISFSHFVF